LCRFLIPNPVYSHCRCCWSRSRIALWLCKQCCGSETFHYGSGSDFSMSSGSRFYFQKVSVSEPAFFLMKYDLKDPKMAFQNIIFKEYLNLVQKIVKIMKLPLFWMVSVNVYIYFQIRSWIRIRNPRGKDPDPAKVPDPCGSGSTTLSVRVLGMK
jgi:hypothetical protein